jgi:threonine dehydrogenase-like Zn-dependent dehydrogenase
VHLDGGLQEWLDVKANAAFPAGDLDAGCTAFAEPMSIAVHALRRADPTAGDGEGKALVLGAGPNAADAFRFAAKHEPGAVKIQITVTGGGAET